MRKHRSRTLVAVLSLLLLLAGTSLGQQEGQEEDTAEESGALVIGLRQDPEVGSYLIDEEGNSLYLFTEDEEGTSTCTGECAENWPPVLTAEWPIGRDGVVPGFLGTVEQEDGQQQVTYRGVPLYYFAGDEEPGQVEGHGQNDSWFLVTQLGEAVSGTPTGVDYDQQASEGQDQEVDQAAMQAGQTVYSQFCAACHGNNGQGGQGTPLAGESRLANTTAVVTQILVGGDDMPAFGGTLDDEQIAHVSTYIRNAWGNSFGPVTPEEVESRR